MRRAEEPSPLTALLLLSVLVSLTSARHADCEVSSSTYPQIRPRKKDYW